MADSNYTDDPLATVPPDPTTLVSEPPIGPDPSTLVSEPPTMPVAPLPEQISSGITNVEPIALYDDMYVYKTPTGWVRSKTSPDDLGLEGYGGYATNKKSFFENLSQITVSKDALDPASPYAKLPYAEDPRVPLTEEDKIAQKEYEAMEDPAPTGYPVEGTWREDHRGLFSGEKQSGVPAEAIERAILAPDTRHKPEEDKDIPARFAPKTTAKGKAAGGWDKSKISDTNPTGAYGNKAWWEANPDASTVAGKKAIDKATPPETASEALMRLGQSMEAGAEAEAKAIGLEYDIEGKKGTKAKHDLEAKLNYQSQAKTARETFLNQTYPEAVLIQKYPGAPLSQIKNWNKALEKQKTIEAGEYLASPQEKEEALRNAAVAKRGLAKAEEIDTGRAYGNIGSKILAALSVGLGSYASSRGGGRNTALDIYQNAIATDVAAQKEMFLHKRGAPGRATSQYKFFMDKYNNEKLATLSVSAAKWGEAAESLNKVAALAKGSERANKIYAQAAQAKATEDKLTREAAKLASQVKHWENTGVEGIRYTGGAREPTEYEKKLLWGTVQPTIGVMAAAKSFQEAYEEAYGLKGEDAEAAAKMAREAFISSLGAFFDKGVLQEFERKELEKVIPGMQTALEKAWRAVGSQKRVDSVVRVLQKIVDRKLDATVDTLSNYQYEEGVRAPIGKLTGRMSKTVAAEALVESNRRKKKKNIGMYLPF